MRARSNGFKGNKAALPSKPCVALWPADGLAPALGPQGARLISEIYVDAVEWVELPNTPGMSQYADGGVTASKPYAATGEYVARMSPHCKSCRYDPARRTGTLAFPFFTFYWDFLLRHQSILDGNPCVALQVKNLTRQDDARRLAVRDRAGAIQRGEVGAADHA